MFESTFDPFVPILVHLDDDFGKHDDDDFSPRYGRGQNVFRRLADRPQSRRRHLRHHFYHLCVCLRLLLE